MPISIAGLTRSLSSWFSSLTAAAAETSDESAVDFVNDLPPEIGLKFFEFLPNPDLQRCMGLSRKWRILSKDEYSRRFTLDSLKDLADKLKPFVTSSDLHLAGIEKLEEWEKKPIGLRVHAVLIGFANIGKLHVFVEELKKQNNFQALDVVNMHPLSQFFNPDVSPPSSQLPLSMASLVEPSYSENPLLKTLAKILGEGGAVTNCLEIMKPKLPSLYNDWETIMEKKHSERVNMVLQVLNRKKKLHEFLKGLEGIGYRLYIDMIKEHAAKEMFLSPPAMHSEEDSMKPIDILNLSPADQLPFLDALAYKLFKLGKDILLDIKAIIQREIKGHLDWTKFMEKDTYLCTRDLIKDSHKKKILHHFMSALEELKDQDEGCKNAIQIIRNDVTSKLFIEDEFSTNSIRTPAHLETRWRMENLAYELKKSGLFNQGILLDIKAIIQEEKKGYEEWGDALYGPSGNMIYSLLKDLYLRDLLPDFMDALNKLKDDPEEKEKAEKAIEIICKDEITAELFIGPKSSEASSWDLKASNYELSQVEILAYKLKKSGFESAILRNMKAISKFIPMKEINEIFTDSSKYPRPIRSILYKLFCSGKCHLFMKDLEELEEQYVECKNAIAIINADENLKKVFSSK